MTDRLALLNDKPVKDLVVIYNRITGSEVKRFATKTAGLKRISKALTDADVANKLDAVLGVESVAVGVIAEGFDDGTPIESPGEVLAKIAKKGAKKAMKPKPIDGSDLVVYRGRICRPENAKKLDKGPLWGACGNRPKDSDKFKGEHSGVNLNYPVRPRGITKLRPGSQREQLIKLMLGSKAKGVTIAQVAKMFSISEKLAIYKLRDLNYVGGHGLRVKKGRVFAYAS
jgi:hypothetical protein